MRICVAQTRPIKGDLKANLGSHKKMIDIAVSHCAGSIFFPELSLTGYEPGLAKELATDANDSRLDEFQKISDSGKIIIGAGLPTRSDDGNCISMVIFQPKHTRKVYSKKYLHPDEEAFFVRGRGGTPLADKKSQIALAICYEISIPEHSANAHRNGAGIYVASVAKSVPGVEKAVRTLSEIAGKYSMTVLMSNCVGHCDDFDCGGKTSIWNNRGQLAGQLDEKKEGILIIDLDTGEIIAETI